MTIKTTFRRLAALLLVLALAVSCAAAALAEGVPRQDTPIYKVAFYASNCYHIQDESGQRSGYGYEMMQGLSKYMQCTFDYVGYDKTPEESVEALRNGEVDLYTAAKVTDERRAEFAVSQHPAITASTCMNIKVTNTQVVAGDYSTYEGLRIGLLQRHTYNDRFLQWAEDKGFAHTITYYETPTDLTNALVDDEVDAIVDSYIRTPEDETTIENFGQTAYYILARKEDQALIDGIDAAFDAMNLETPNWRVELYNKYYGAQERNTEFTASERALLEQMQQNGTVIRAATDPDNAPYSWYEDGEMKGIAVDYCTKAADELGLSVEVVPLAERDDYRALLDSGEADLWLDIDSQEMGTSTWRYQLTSSYMNTTMSMLRQRGAYGTVRRVAVMDDTVAVRKILASNWPGAELVLLDGTSQCVEAVLSGGVDGALLMTYTAQTLAREDVQNRLRTDIVPGVTIQLYMAVNAEDDYNFYGLWEKALSIAAVNGRGEIVQNYNMQAEQPTAIEFLFDNPAYLIFVMVVVAALVCFILMYWQSARSRRKQEEISEELAAALDEAHEASTAKQDFFSKMSHDIRTPLNVVLGMTQIAQKYKHDTPRLESALESIANEGNYLLVLINSILDVNQLEHGHMELNNAPFDAVHCARNSVELLRPLADKKAQTLELVCDKPDFVVVGDSNRYSQIMINIISNAIKYTPVDGRITVQLDCLPGGRVIFRCKDTGIGMTPEFISHITEDYVRAEDSRVSKVQGTGLGMSVVKGFTDLMGGTLDVYSREGHGSTFVVSVPFTEATDEQREAVLAPRRKAEQDNAAQYVGKRVLLAEDNALNAEIATELLQSIGLTVDWREDGKQALEAFEQSEIGSYFAVFMDMQMPVMDGVEATRRIRASARPDHDVPIFAMTANTFAADRKKCFDAGMSGYIPKPIDLETITHTLEEGTGE